ncbi:hypothetical protein [Aureimonas populi]|uniref:Uncharacterized protein n=1 Tax=Aureimonas populi TaxID=1701758 RepID=A0ABW5CGS6_9HYPH|nr:hypothetical protein [Aureimonas populi]
MTSFDYAKTAATAERLLARFGQEGAIRVQGVRESDWDDEPGPPVDHPCRLAVLPIADRDIDGALIKAGDVKILVSTVGLSITPTTVNTVIAANGTFTIVRVKTLAPAGVAVLHDLMGRR